MEKFESIGDRFIGFSLKEYGEYSDIELTIILHFIKKVIQYLILVQILELSVPISKKIGEKGNPILFWTSRVNL